MGHVFCQGYCWKGKERGNLSEIVLALDTEDLASADRMLELLGSKLKFVKIGPRLFYLGGRNFVMSLKTDGTYCWTSNCTIYRILWEEQFPPSPRWEYLD